VSNPLALAFDLRLKSQPDRIVARCRHSTLSAAELSACADGIASLLPPLPSGTAIALAARGASFLAGWLACLRRDLAPVLLDFKTPRGERSRIARELGTCGSLSLHDAWPAGTPAGHWETFETPPRAALGELAAIKLTSGSTGAPRGIAVSADALLADDAQLTRAMQLESSRVFIANLPLSHSYGLASLAVPALVRDVTLIFPEDSGPSASFALARDSGAEFLPTVPAWLDAVSRMGELPSWPRSLRTVVSAGSPLAPATAARFRERFGVSAHVFYGSSETGGIAYDRTGEAAERGTVGEPIAGVGVAIDADSRVRVTSAAVASGYMPEADARLAAGSFLTSDLGRFEDGELRLLGRADDWILIRGKSVNPREIEELLRQLPGVEEVAVVASPGRVGGGAEPVIRAAIAPQPAGLEVTAVMSFCARRLADYKVPRSVRFYDALPRTERGKVDRAAIAGEAPAARR
jgi:long-chain acyl-CoA synthetase